MQTQRTAAATAARVRRAQEKAADKLRDAGWTVIPPGRTVAPERSGGGQ